MKNKVDKPRSNPFISGLIKAFFDLINHFIKDFDNIRKVKKIDKFSEEFSTIEHLLVRLEKKMEEQRFQIEDLKTRILWGNIVIIILILLNIFYFIK
jgi:hypothetical protein